MIAALALSDLTTPITVAEARQSIYDVLGIIGVSTTDWRPGAVVRTVITAVSIMIASLSVLIALIAGSGFLALSSGSWLTLVARYVYGVERVEADFAVGSVTLTNATGGVFSWDPDELTFECSATGKTYRNTAAISLGAMTNVQAAIRADEIGTLSNAPAGGVNALTPPLGGISVTNAAAVVGRDQESDPDLRLRCSEKLGSLSPNGPSDAYAYIARSAVRADGSPIGINRVRVVPNGATGVKVYLATSAGAVPGTIGNTATDLGLVDELIQQKCVPIPIVATVASATPFVINVEYTAFCYNTAGVTQAQAEGYIEASLQTMFAAQPIGGNRVDALGRLYDDDINRAIGRAASSSGPLPIFHVSVDSPTTDVVIADGAVPTLGTVTGAVTMVLPEGL